MAITYNPILQGLSGKLGKVVLRQLNGKTIVQAAPVRKAAATPGEIKERQTFRKAVDYAKQARTNAALWEIYKAEAKRRGGTSNWFAVAISDYRKGLKLAGTLPEIKQNTGLTPAKSVLFTDRNRKEVIEFPRIRMLRSRPRVSMPTCFIYSYLQKALRHSSTCAMPGVR